MATSKIKEIAEIKPYEGKHGTTYYHNLVMENDDRINIGKKKQQEVGWELDYEIIESGQHEFNKAKTPQKEGYSGGNAGGGGAARGGNPETQRAIIYQNSFTQANSFCALVGFGTEDKNEQLKQLCSTADFIAKFIIEKSKEV